MQSAVSQFFASTTVVEPVQFVVQQEKDQARRHPGLELHQVQIVSPLYVAPFLDLKLQLQPAQLDRLFDRERFVRQRQREHDRFEVVQNELQAKQAAQLESAQIVADRIGRLAGYLVQEHAVGHRQPAVVGPLEVGDQRVPTSL